MIEPLTPEQQAFATKYHGLILDFMKQYSLNNDFYDLLAYRYLKVVVRYTTEEELQQYAFSTILWRNLRSELSNYWRNVNKQPILVSLEDIFWEPSDEDSPIDPELWKCIEATLTKKQCEAIYLRNQGFSNLEIGKICGITKKAVEKRFFRIRKRMNKEK